MRLRTHTPAKAFTAAAIAVLCIISAAPAASADTVASKSAAPPAAGDALTRSASTAVTAAAEVAIGAARSTAQSAAGKVDTTQLGIQIVQLDDLSSLPEFVVIAFTGLLETTTSEVSSAVTVYDAAQVKAAQEAAAAAAAAAAAQARGNTPDGARATARALAQSGYGWGDAQFSCLSSLWQKESGWNYLAHNSSGATGIPQALPGSKMSSAGSDWATNASTQIAWGLGYISRGYGSPCSAWAHSQSVNWY